MMRSANFFVRAPRDESWRLLVVVDPDSLLFRVDDLPAGVRVGVRLEGFLRLGDRDAGALREEPERHERVLREELRQRRRHALLERGA